MIDMSVSQNWLKRMAEAESDVIVSTGGWISDLRSNVAQEHVAQKPHMLKQEHVPTLQGTAWKREEIRHFLENSAQALQVAARGFESLSDSAVDVLFEEIQEMKAKAASR